MYLGTLLELTCVIVIPLLAILGLVWVRSATQKASLPRFRLIEVWMAVTLMCLLPLVTFQTCWPLRLAFLSVRPAMDRVADQVVAGQPVGFPRWVGPFRLAGSAVDPVSGNVGLMVDPNPNGPLGFVRVRTDEPPNRLGPFPWNDLLVDFGRGWEYREAD